MAEAGGAQWYYLPVGPGAQPVGPLTHAALQGVMEQGALAGDTYVWHSGLPEWLPWSQVQQSTATIAADTSLPPAVSNTGGGGGKPAAVVASAPKIAEPEDPLASFMGEISAIEAEAEAKKGGPVSVDSPAPEDREFTDDDGTVYRWDGEKRKFLPLDAAAAPSAVNYSLEDMMYQPVEERIPTVSQAKAAEANDADPLTGQKRQRAEAMEKEKEKIAKAKEAAKETKKKEETWFELKKNTNVYVTGLPSDVTVEEMQDAFGKCGIIKENDDRTPRIKLYRDAATGMLKGDGLVTFLKEPSVDIACTIMDGAPLRPGGPPMSVTVAQFQQKSGHQPKKKQPNKKQKKNVVVNQEKRLDWNGWDDVKKAEDVTVILKHMFTLEELQAEPTLAAELKEDVAAECAKLGPIERVKMFQGNPEGVMSVRFKMEDAAEACVKLMNGRFFGGRRIVAHKYDGKTNYNIRVQETAEEQAARLEAFTRELEAGGG